ACAEGGVTPPARVTSERVFTAADRRLFALLTTVSVGATLGAVWSWLHEQPWTDHPLAAGLLTTVLLAGLAMYHARWLTLPSMRRPTHMPARQGWKVGVATTFVPGAETIEMLEETLSAIVAIEYPHDAWVLDEGDDDEVKRLCRRLGARHFSRSARPQYQTEHGRFAAASKHGNYNAWLSEV